MSILLQLPGIDNSLGGVVGVSSIVEAYREVLPKLYLTEIVGLATLFAVIIIIVRMVGVIKDAYSENEPMNIRKIFGLCEEYIKVAAILVFAPFMFYYIELGFSYIQDALVVKFKSDNILLEKALEAEGSTGILDNIAFTWQMAAGGMKTTIEFLLAALLKYAFYMVVAGRFLYLLLLQIVQPFAIVAFLSEKTRHFSLKYIGHLGYTYLVIPMILIADVFADKMTVHFLDNLKSVTIIYLAVAFILKISLYKVANSICKNVMSI